MSLGRCNLQRNYRKLTGLEQLIKIELFGQPYTFKAETEVDKARAVADFLMQEVQKVEAELGEHKPHSNKTAILISAALNIANDYFELRRNHRDLLKNITERSESVLRRMQVADLTAEIQR